MFSKRKLYIVLLIVVLGFGGVYVFTREDSKVSVIYKTPEEKDASVRFVMEAFDSIRKNFWTKSEEGDLASHFQLSLQKAQNTLTLPILTTRDRAGVAKMFADALKIATSTESKKNLTVGVVNVALYNLPPFGRSALLSQKQEVALRESVANVDSNKDLYKDLGLEKGATVEEVSVAYKEKAETLVKDPTPEAQAQLAKVSHAKEVLTNPNTRDLYDTAKIEPTALTNIMGKTLYMKIDRISPTTIIEFGRTVYSASNTPNLNSMIIDLRDNLGGSLDFAQSFLGLFLGQNQFAFDLFQQDNYNVQRTNQVYFPELSRYKEIVVLVNEMTQSTAEVTAAAFKRFKLGTVVGKTTRGWGTVENTFPLETTIDETEKYALLLVHSITLREDGTPIEGRGVDPHVSITNPQWRNNIREYVKSPEFIQVIEKVISKPFPN